MREDISEAMLVGVLKASRDRAREIATQFIDGKTDTKAVRNKLAELLSSTEQITDQLDTVRSDLVADDEADE